MGFPQGIDFRATSGYVTDPADHTYEIGITANYPRTTAQGNNVGWETSSESRNRSTSPDARLAGNHRTTGTTVTTYRMDLPAAGSYSIKLAAGDYSYASGIKVELFDSTTSLGVLASTSTTASARFRDATDVEHTAANWPANNNPATKTFASTILRAKVGSTGGGGGVIASLYVAAAGGGAADLVLQNSAHAHSAASPTLSSAHALIAAASAHAHTAANLALSSAMGLSVSPATHAHAADAPALSAALFLLIQNTLHAHAAGNVTLDNTGALVLTIADALHAHTANPLTISQAVTLAVANALHPHTADAPTLQTLVSLMIAHAQHGHAADNIAFGIAVIELVQDLMLDALYQAGDFGLAVDCLLGQAAFTAFLDTADDDYFAAQSTGHTLRYRLGVPLQTGDQVTIDGTLYRVNGAARQINSGEMRAALVRVPS